MSESWDEPDALRFTCDGCGATYVGMRAVEAAKEKHAGLCPHKPTRALDDVK